MYNFPLRNYLIYEMKEFYSDHFIEIFFKSFTSGNDFSQRIDWGKDHYKKQRNRFIEGFDKSLDYFEDELMQIVATTNQTCINHYFESLKEIVKDWGLIDKENIYNWVTEYNNRQNDRFNEETKTELENFFSNEMRTKFKHLEAYQTENRSFGILTYGSFGQLQTEINYNIFCHEEWPEVVDLDYMVNYCEFLNFIHYNFRQRANKHIKIYERGKYQSTNSVTMVNPHFNVQAPDRKLLEELDNKFKTTLTVPQLALLFRLVSDLKPDIFENDTNTELFRSISQNFTSKRTGENTISEHTLKKFFGEPEAKAIDFWKKHLSTMQTKLKSM